MILRIVILFLTFGQILGQLGLYAQTPHFGQYRIIKDKKNFNITAICQDSTGFIWFATSEGLFKFDGIEFKNFNLPDSIKLIAITALAASFNNELWLGFNNGTIACIGNNKLGYFEPEEGIGKAAVSSFFFAPDSSLWFTTLGEGVYYYSGKHRKRIYNLSTDEGLGDNYAYSIAQSANGHIYIGTDNGISIFDNSSKTFIGQKTMKDGLPDNIVRKLLFAPDDNLWIATDEGGFCLYMPLQKQFFTYSWKYGQISDMLLNTKGELWISTNGNGIVRTNTNNPAMLRQYTHKHGLHCNTTERVFADFEDNVWIACKSGVSKVNSNSIEVLGPVDGFTHSEIFSFILDSHNNYWVAASDGLFKYTFNQNLTTKPHKLFSHSANVANSFVSLYEDTDGFIWAGTYGFGAYRIHPNTFKATLFSTLNGLPDDNVISITGNKNEIWLATLGGGAVCFDIVNNRIKKVYDISNGLSGNYVYTVFSDSKNRKWFALDGAGWAMLDGEKLFVPKFKPNLQINTVYAFAEDANLNMWLISPDKGLCRLYENVFEPFNFNGLNKHNLTAIAADETGNIILVNPEGVQLLNVNNITVANYNVNDGLSQFEPVLNAIHIDKNNTIRIASSSAIVSINGKFSETKLVVPRTELLSVQLFFNDILKSQHSFSYKQNHFSFIFNAFWFQAPDKLLYRYMLENYDYSWSIEGKNKYVVYSNLPPGKYRFKVQVSHRAGEWLSSPNAEFYFTIKKPFWQTWWFISIGVLTVVTATYLFFRIRLHNLQKAREILEDEVRRRTATILHQKEEIETQRDEIEAQRDFVVQQRDQIAAQNQNITSSIEYASRIQKAVMPPANVLHNFVTDFFILNRPMHIVSGDFYWFTEKNNLLVLAVADCTGHGVPGAFMSMLGITLLNDIVSNSKILSAAIILDKLREMVKNALRQKGESGEAQDGMDIALVVIDNQKLTLNYAGANAPLYVVRNGELLTFLPDKMPIGIFVRELAFTDKNVQLIANDRVFLSSDGYPDQLGGPADSKFKSRRFRELLLNTSHLTMAEQKLQLEKTMDDWKKGQTQNDDIMIISLQF